MQLQLKDLKIGDHARIVKIEAGEKNYRHRLITMGLLPGTAFTLSHIAPLGDPIEIRVRGFALSLRKQEASLLRCEKITKIIQKEEAAL